MKKIKQIYEFGFYDDGYKFEYMLYPDRDFPNSHKKLMHSTEHTLLNIQEKIIYEDGSEYVLPVSDLIDVLADHQSFLIRYFEEPSKFSKEKSYPWFFARPNNAAIYNSDGSLRHQLIWTDDLENKNNWYIYSTYYADFPNLKGWGVMVTSDHFNPSLNFCLYDGTPNLIWTGYSQERR